MPQLDLSDAVTIYTMHINLSYVFLCSTTLKYKASNSDFFITLIMSTRSSGTAGNDLTNLSEHDMEDLELNPIPSVHLVNDVVKTFGWKDINVVVKDRTSKEPLSILAEANGLVRAGEMIAIMGPSGSGKTTLLNTLSHRLAAAGATTHGEILTNGQVINWQNLRHLSAYVEQDDALIGSLTVRETMDFAARLALPT